MPHPDGAGTKWRMAGSGFLGPRGMRTCSQGKKVADGGCGQGGRDEGVLRSHQIHRGLRGCGQPEPDCARHAERPFGEFTPARRWHDRYLHHAHATSRLRSCCSVRRLRRWVRLHYRPFDGRAILDTMVSPPTGKSLGYAAIPLPSAPTPHWLAGTEDVPAFRNWLSSRLSHRIRHRAARLPLKNGRSSVAAAPEYYS